MPSVEFVVFGTPVSAQGAAGARRMWKQRVATEAKSAAPAFTPARFDELVLRVAYFFEYAPAADLDNIVKPIQDALKGIFYQDDAQVVDLVASMRRKAIRDRIRMNAMLAKVFGSGSDFVYVAVDRSARIEVFS